MRLKEIEMIRRGPRIAPGKVKRKEHYLPPIRIMVLF